jgi:hypothetical protein
MSADSAVLLDGQLRSRVLELAQLLVSASTASDMAERFAAALQLRAALLDVPAALRADASAPADMELTIRSLTGSPAPSERLTMARKMLYGVPALDLSCAPLALGGGGGPAATAPRRGKPKERAAKAPRRGAAGRAMAERLKMGGTPDCDVTPPVLAPKPTAKRRAPRATGGATPRRRRLSVGNAGAAAHSRSAPSAPGARSRGGGVSATDESSSDALLELDESAAAFVADLGIVGIEHSFDFYGDDDETAGGLAFQTPSPTARARFLSGDGGVSSAASDQGGLGDTLDALDWEAGSQHLEAILRTLDDPELLAMPPPLF